MTDTSDHDGADHDAADHDGADHDAADHGSCHHHGHRHDGAGDGRQPGHPHSATGRVGNAVRLVFGRGRMASVVADVALLTPADRVVDIGCGPGTAVRVASRRCARATGVDPDPTSLRLARWLSWVQRRHNVEIVAGSAEAIPLPDASATVVWSITAVHHWADRAAGLAEARRVPAPGGRVFLVERLSPPDARGHQRFGMTEAQLDRLEDDAARRRVPRGAPRGAHGGPGDDRGHSRVEAGGLTPRRRVLRTGRRAGLWSTRQDEVVSGLGAVGEWRAGRCL